MTICILISVASSVLISAIAIHSLEKSITMNNNECKRKDIKINELSSEIEHIVNRMNEELFKVNHKIVELEKKIVK
jgi:cell division protein FtsL